MTRLLGLWCLVPSLALAHSAGLGTATVTEAADG
ncbi:MAG: hypothetical protein H6Q89_4414, partial [Myxococcaceae bacterium]|nr:hypothetical protein [Myxococcaceae bacterium]